MSRRAKRWIAAIFVLLTTGLMVYLTLAWSPDNPLRFRVVHPRGAAAADPSVPQEVVVEVENTTSFPLLFITADVGREDIHMMNMGSIRMHGQTPALLNAEGTGMELKGGQRILVVANMSKAWHRDATEYGARVRYRWCSKAEYWFTMRWVQVATLLPQRLWEFIPYPTPSNDNVPLEPFAKDKGS